MKYSESSSDMMFQGGIGTTAYSPPELLSHTSYSFPVDIYSLAATLYATTILGHDPFQSSPSQPYMITYIRSGFLQSGLNWPDPKPSHMDSPTLCTDYRHYASFFGTSRGIFIPGTSSYMRYVNGDRVEPDLLVELVKGLQPDPGHRPSAEDMVRALERIDGGLNIEL